VPDLPLVFHDEAGFLMRNIQETVLEHEKFIIEKQDLIYLLSHFKNLQDSPNYQR
jgi:hypothetical protein